MTKTSSHEDLDMLTKRLSDSASAPHRSRLAHAQGWELLNERIAGHATPRSRWKIGRWFAIPAGLAVVFGIVVLMSFSALPGDVTYAVKRATENAQVRFASSDSKKADACSMQMKRRANELARLQPSRLTVQTVNDLNSSILEEAAEFQEYIQKSGNDKSRLVEQRQRDIRYVIAALQSAGSHAEGSAQKTAIDQIIKTLQSNG
jgi:hypothetical protein